MVRSVFVTVGTTRFDGLITAVAEHPFQKALLKQGYQKLVVQRGRSSGTLEGLAVELESFEYKPTLAEEFSKADLVISHAGSGSIMEALRARKPLIVVVNEGLMDNHQADLAKALQEKNYLVACTPQELLQTLVSWDPQSVVSYPEPDPSIFGKELDSLMGFQG